MQEAEVTTIYQAWDLLTNTRQATVKCDHCGKRASITIKPGSAFEDNRCEMVDTLNFYGWDFNLTPEGHCLCSQHGGAA